jgi:pimeloyl-ACP methyl ester carboxylesterase
MDRASREGFCDRRRHAYRNSGKEPFMSPVWSAPTRRAVIATSALSGAAGLSASSASAIGAPPARSDDPAALMSTSSSLTYRTVSIDGLNIFYRQAGPDDAPTLLLLHGYPSSSRMFDTLMPLLADRYRLIAPDYPGFGLSDAPPADQFAYTFDHLAEVVGKFTDAIGLHSYVLYIQDYGGPIGFRLALANPERVKGFIVQNAVASEDGLGPAWDIRKAYWRDRATYEAQVIPGFTSLDGARSRHIGASPHPERYNPDAWLDEYALLARPGQQAIQADLFWSYQTNVAAYPKWQAWMRQRQPPMLVVWGRYDPSFAVAGATAYKKAVPSADLHILDAGHFALDEKVDEIAGLIRRFLARQPALLGDGPNVARQVSSRQPAAT